MRANWECNTAEVKVCHTLVSSACWIDSFSLWQLTRRTRSLYWALYSTVSWRESPSLCWKSWLQCNISRLQYDLILLHLFHTLNILHIRKTTSKGCQSFSHQMKCIQHGFQYSINVNTFHSGTYSCKRRKPWNDSVIYKHHMCSNVTITTKQI
jgi:hypothetical protein